MLIKNLKGGKYKIESVGENGNVEVFLQDGLVEVEGAPFKIDTAGEYEIKGIHIYGINGGIDKKPIFLAVTQEKAKVAYIGRLENPLSKEQVDELSDTDILISFIGGGNVKAIGKIEPNILIPMNYSPELVQKHFPGMSVRTVNKLVIKNKEELAGEMEIVVIS